MIFILKLDYEFRAENIEAAKEIVSQMVVSHPEEMIQTNEALTATEESVIELHEKTGEL